MGELGDRMSDVSEPSVDEFVRLETRVWQALVDGDPEADARMLSDDFLGVDPAGFSDRAYRCEIVRFEGDCSQGAGMG